MFEDAWCFVKKGIFRLDVKTRLRRGLKTKRKTVSSSGGQRKVGKELMPTDRNLYRYAGAGNKGSSVFQACNQCEFKPACKALGSGFFGDQRQ